MTNIENLKQIRLITKHYDHLQGLRQIPMGLLLLLLAASKAGWWPWFEKWQPLSGLMFIGLSLILYGWVGLYYERTFGRVQRQDQRNWIGIGVGIAYLITLWLVGLAEYEWQWPVSATGLCLAAGLAGYYLQTGRFRTHFLVLALLMAGVSLLPLTGVMPVAQVYLWGPEGVVGAAVFGLIVLIGGLADHWFLTRSLYHHDEMGEVS